MGRNCAGRLSRRGAATRRQSPPSRISFRLSSADLSRQNQHAIDRGLYQPMFAEWYLESQLARWPVPQVLGSPSHSRANARGARVIPGCGESIPKEPLELEFPVENHLAN